MSEELKMPEWYLKCALAFAHSKAYEFEGFKILWLQRNPLTQEPIVPIVAVAAEAFLTEKPSPNTQETPTLNKPAYIRDDGLAFQQNEVIEEKPKRKRTRKKKEPILEETPSG